MLQDEGYARATASYEIVAQPEARAVDWISSASIVVRRSAIEEIGLVDEEYFIYSDETDWQYRLWQAGWKVYYLPEVYSGMEGHQGQPRAPGLVDCLGSWYIGIEGRCCVG
mgnify:CR=1 FL=1